MVFVFSTIFMGIWNSDQKAMNSTIARNKRLNKTVVAFPIPPVETVYRENMSVSLSPEPEPRPVRVAMRSNDTFEQTEPVIERQKDQAKRDAHDEIPPVNPAASDVPIPQVSGIESVTIVDPKVEPAAIETVLPESARTQQEEHLTTEAGDMEIEPEAAPPALEASIVHDVKVDVLDTNVAEIETEMVPAPEDFAVASIVDSGLTEAATEVQNDTSEEIVEQTTKSTEIVSSNVAEIIAGNSPVMIADHSGDDSLIDLSRDNSAHPDQPLKESRQAELAEPAIPITEDIVEATDAQSDVVGEENSAVHEDGKRLEAELLQSGDYDMLDVHAEDVSAGTLAPAIDGGATCIPLPRNLASGTWQVIHSSGEFFRITIDRGGNSTMQSRNDSEDALETSFCITTTPEGVRWCFIRSFIDAPTPVRRVTTEFFSPGQQ